MVQPKDMPSIEETRRILTAHFHEQSQVHDRLAIYVLRRRGTPPSAEAIKRLSESHDNDETRARAYATWLSRPFDGNSPYPIKQHAAMLLEAGIMDEETANRLGDNDALAMMRNMAVAGAKLPYREQQLARQYDLHRRWVLTYVQIARERDLDPVTVVERQKTREEAIRRMFSRDDFILHEIGEIVAKRYAMASMTAALRATAQTLHMPPEKAIATSAPAFEALRLKLTTEIAIDQSAIERFYLQEADRIYGATPIKPS